MKNEKVIATLTIINDMAYVPIAINFVKGISQQLSFDRQAQQHIEIAVEEAVSNVIKHAFAPGEEGSYDIQCLQTTMGMQIRIADKGLPFDPALTSEYRSEADLDEQTGEGLGSFLINSLMDEVEFRNLGSKGKETRLIKFFPRMSVTTDNNNSNLHFHKEIPSPDPVTEKELTEMVVRQMEPREAIEVCRCFFDAYGYSYAYDNVYYPERLAALNQSGEIFSAVMVTPDCEVAAHSALAFAKHLPGVAEVAMGVVKSRYRGHDLLEKILLLLYREASNSKLNGVFCSPVTVHTYSQRIIAKQGFKQTAFLLAYIPADTSFKGIAESLSQRGSVVIYYLPLVNVSETQTVYVPARHEEIIRKIYQGLNIPVAIGKAAKPESLEKQSLMNLSINSMMLSATIRFNQYGQDVKDRLHEVICQVKREGLQVMEVFLNTADPFTPYVAEFMESLGFLFMGILPGTIGGDMLIMQYFNGILVPFDTIKVEEGLGQELLEYIRSNHDSAWS